jgi:hypothetical protein
MTDGQSARLSWCQAPIWGLRPDFYCCQSVADLLMWGVPSHERTGLPFTIARGPRQLSHSWVRVLRDSPPYFSVSDLKPTQPRGPGPRNRVAQLKVKVMLRPFVTWGSFSWNPVTSMTSP